MSIYSVNLFNILARLLPPFLRGGSLHFFVLVAFMELELLKAQFDSKRESIDSRLKFTAQVVYLAEYLNQVYDPTLKRIEVQDGTLGLTYLYKLVDGASAPYLYSIAEREISVRIGKIGEVLGAYEVIVPDALFSTVTANQQIQNKIDFFNPAGVSYLVRSDAFVDSPLATGTGYDPSDPLYNS